MFIMTNIFAHNAFNITLFILFSRAKLKNDIDNDKIIVTH